MERENAPLEKENHLPIHHFHVLSESSGAYVMEFSTAVPCSGHFLCVFGTIPLVSWWCFFFWRKNFNPAKKKKKNGPLTGRNFSFSLSFDLVSNQFDSCPFLCMFCLVRAVEWMVVLVLFRLSPICHPLKQLHETTPDTLECACCWQSAQLFRGIFGETLL